MLRKRRLTEAERKKMLNKLLENDLWNFVLEAEMIGGRRHLLHRILASNNKNARDIYGRSLLHRAIIEDNKELFELCLRNKLNVEARDDDGRTPLFIAVILGKQYYIDRLIEHRANINIKDNYDLSLKDIYEGKVILKGDKNE